jgi:hypothetical protein
MPLVAPPDHRPEPRFWALDPLFSAHVKLLGSQLAALPAATEAPEGDVVWLLNHPIRYLDAVGVCVSVDPKHPVPGHDLRLSFTLDDGSGLIECVCWLREQPATAQRQLISQCRLGAVLHVLGRLGAYREQRQVTVDRCWVETDPLAEAMHWARARALWHECYSISFRVPSQAMQHQEHEQAAAPQRPLQQQPQQQDEIQQGSTSKPPARPSQQLREHVRSVFIAEAQRGDGGALTVSDVVGRLPSCAKKECASAGGVQRAVRECVRLMEEEESEIFVADTRRGREQAYRWAGGGSPGMPADQIEVNIG